MAAPWRRGLRRWILGAPPYHRIVLQAEQGQIQIHTENIFPIIKKAVYSGHEVFLRELVSNGVDATSKRRMASMAGD
jgi:molecular chaperone HtpG